MKSVYPITHVCGVPFLTMERTRITVPFRKKFYRRKHPSDGDIEDIKRYQHPYIQYAVLK
jgi:hypothetical protein